MSPRLLAEKICLVIEAILNFFSSEMPDYHPHKLGPCSSAGRVEVIISTQEEQFIFVTVSGLANKIMSLPVVAHVLCTVTRLTTERQREKWKFVF